MFFFRLSRFYFNLIKRKVFSLFNLVFNFILQRKMTIIGRLIFFSFFCLNFSFVWNHRFSLNEKHLLKEIRQILVDWMSQDGKLKYVLNLILDF